LPSPDYDDPKVEEQWCGDRRVEVARYLAGEGVAHGRIGEWPAWHVAPCVSVWAIESKVRPGAVGWWVICGDLPTDYVSAAEIKDPRKALQAFADRWQEYREAVRSGAPPPEFTLDGADRSPVDLTRLLEKRAKFLSGLAGDDSVWEGV
jgi:hypothetical protein